MSQRAWVASAREARWHVCDVTDSGGSFVVACGHRLYGPVHRRIREGPPVDRRSVCQVCANIVNWLPALPSKGDEIMWPFDDPDDPPQTDRARILAEALEVDRSEVVPASPYLAGTTSAKATEVSRIA
ncbi:hypothetical protein [Saccharopolyspora elongata]|uniref:Uncharacterized protein n=1 Tax=Saccharopolyspora elongata TaxID=2530387 RepID=A0A4R4Z244_9PSEU|nr:hypothetical protein [Saccharopolyspora elongata]TDD50112.1 hypothetical protein E1288_18035 [Saccharopolyspora elongata]